MEVYFMTDKLLKEIEENPQARVIGILKEVKEKSIDLTPEWRPKDYKNPLQNELDKVNICTPEGAEILRMYYKIEDNYSQCLRDIIKELEDSGGM